MSKKVFISFCKEDHVFINIVKKLAINFDFLDIIIVDNKKHPGQSLADKIKNEIDTCHYFIVILTKHSLNNQWVNQEIGYATAKGKTIYPILDTQIFNDLKGFIHNQLDIPFSFDSKDVIPAIRSKRFKSTLNDLFNFIENKEFEYIPIDILWRLNPWKSDCATLVDNKVIFKGATAPSNADVAFIDLKDKLEIGKKYEISCFVKSDPNTDAKFLLWCHDKIDKTQPNGQDIATLSKIPSINGEKFKLNFLAINNKDIRIHLHYKIGQGQIEVSKVKISKS